MKKVLAGLAVAAVVLVGYFGYRHHTETALTDALTPHVKNASIRVTNSSELEIKPSQATFKEVFERLDGDVVEIEKHLIEVQSISSTSTEKISSPAIAYLRAAQEFSRSLAMKYRKAFAANNSLERYKEAVQDYVSASSYGYEHAKKRSTQANEDLEKAIEEMKGARSSLLKATEAMKAARVAASAHFSDDALVALKQLDDVTAANTEKPKTDSPAKK